MRKYNHKEKVKSDKIYVLIITLFNLFLVLFVIYMIFFFGKNQEGDLRSIGDEGPYCNNLSLKDTAFCLNDFVSDIFKYNLTDDDIVLNLSELIERGGDCKNYAEYYQSELLKYGFKAEKKVINIEEKSPENNFTKINHAFTISYNQEGYCILDQTEIFCFMYKKE